MNAQAHDIAGRRAPRITAEDVFQAAHALLMEGHRPTIDRVRMKLGRGSPKTINEHLDRWWSSLGARLRDLPGQVLPGLPETATNRLLDLWNLSVREAHQALRASMAAREAALEARTTELERRAAELTRQQESILARDQLEAANRRAETLEAALREREAEFGRLQ